ncbi:MAG: ATP12 family protein [Sphingomonadaceae bacterium]|jgi:chaperone required for assembly of F1-ATPase
MKRFYSDVSVREADHGWRVFLDERTVKTPGGKPQVLPSEALAKAMAEEWAAQGEKIDTSQFVLRDLADYALDTVAADRDAVIADLLPYAETDTLCYRGEEGEPLHLRQVELWEPLLAAAEARYGVAFERVSGIIHRPQPDGLLARYREELETLDDFALASLRMLASLAASLTIALAALEPDADPIALWNAANLEEDWQAELWGSDAEAEERRDLRYGAFETAIRFVRLARAA